jgi:hypothetical protein
LQLFQSKYKYISLFFYFCFTFIFFLVYKLDFMMFWLLYFKLLKKKL